MANPQPVNIVAALTKERSSEIRSALLKMGVAIDENDLVDLDEFDMQKLKKQIAEDTPQKVPAKPAKQVGVTPVKEGKEE